MSVETFNLNFGEVYRVNGEAAATYNMRSVSGSHAHTVRDTDEPFTIDRLGSIDAPKKKLPWRSHNSEQIEFMLPRYIDGHDMSVCDVIQIHYINTDGKVENKGVYEVEEIRVSEDDESVRFDWLISENATQLVGALNFAITFECVTDGTVDYRWGTEICKNLTIGEGIDNGDYIAQEYPDILAQFAERMEGLTTENWTFTLEDGSTVTKAVYVE